MFTHEAFVQMGKLIKKSRVHAGLTQAHLAKKLGYSSAQFCSNWERGTALPPIAALPKIAKYTKTDFNKFGDILVTDFKKVLANAGKGRH